MQQILNQTHSHNQSKPLTWSTALKSALIVGGIALSVLTYDYLNVPSYQEVTVKKGKIDSGEKYVVKLTRGYVSDLDSLQISLPGARIITGRYPGTYFLQNYNIFDGSGKHILREDVYNNLTADTTKEIGYDINSSPREYWKGHSIANTSLRNNLIKLANEVSKKEGLGQYFREGSPDTTTAIARDKSEKGLK